MIRRNLLFQAGLFDETLIYGEDFLFALILSSHSNLYWVQKPCLYLRRYHESMTKNHLRAARENYKADLVALSNPRLKHVRKQLRWHISGVLRVASQVYLNNQLPFNAFISALKAVYWSPNDIRNYSILKSSVFHTNIVRGPINGL